MSLILVQLPPEENNSIHHIIDNIYLGNSDSRHFIKDKSIDRVVEIGEEDELAFYRDIKINDLLTIKIADNRNAKINEYFEKVWEFIIKNDKKVLIHCKMGTSRSVTFVISYLVKMKKMTVEDAINFIDSKRDNKIYTSPNYGFKKILKKLEKTL